MCFLFIKLVSWDAKLYLIFRLIKTSSKSSTTFFVLGNIAMLQLISFDNFSTKSAINFISLLGELHFYKFTYDPISLSVKSIFSVLCKLLEIKLFAAVKMDWVDL